MCDFELARSALMGEQEDAGFMERVVLEIGLLIILRLEGITLVFKNNPLKGVQVLSTFDLVLAVRAFVQSEIKHQLRELIQDQSPSPTLVPDCAESYDPTYGLGPSHPPLIGKFTRYCSLAAKEAQTQGLSEVLEEDDDTKDESIMPTSPSDPLSPPLPYSFTTTFNFSNQEAQFPFAYLIILGGGGVDKSALTVQFVHDPFEKSYEDIPLMLLLLCKIDADG
ncbi:uncharacterized protein MELLADRAFT_108178 [Melampsora larici-populina 98AG31]|uniref:DM34 domain-containing protein n=1 Tax=Melampsora larici-populina (strain 98AG31 / pathotype 3-4-7) TaxID=747676 RepID=F4RS85_MELLP|nr:uncharacterized protein MELLADRAFT_108178 [Melampsora larici-populina 98AG31]EGG04822.1 hypothetical protein MELLADRAFT_108178 [Melampsora larici-populina 98AG31]